MGPSFPRWYWCSRDLIEGDWESLGGSVEEKSLSGGMEKEFLKSSTTPRSLRSGGRVCRLVTKIWNVGVRITISELHHRRVLVSMFTRGRKGYLVAAFWCVEISIDPTQYDLHSSITTLEWANDSEVWFLLSGMVVREAFSSKSIFTTPEYPRQSAYEGDVRPFFVSASWGLTSSRSWSGQKVCRAQAEIMLQDKPAVEQPRLRSRRGEGKGVSVW